MNRDEMANLIGGEHASGRHGIHIVGTGWIELPLYVRQEIADDILEALPTPATGEVEPSPEIFPGTRAAIDNLSIRDHVRRMEAVTDSEAEKFAAALGGDNK